MCDVAGAKLCLALGPDLALSLPCVALALTGVGVAALSWGAMGAMLGVLGDAAVAAMDRPLAELMATRVNKVKIFFMTSPFRFFEFTPRIGSVYTTPCSFGVLTDK